MVVVFTVDRSKQNKQGVRIGDFKSYFDELMKRAGYVKAAHIVKEKFGIETNIKEIQWD